MKVIPFWFKSFFTRHYLRASVPDNNYLRHVHQPIFVLFLMLVAFFSRSNPNLVFPQIIYLFVLFLFSNAATNYVLSTYKVRYWGIDLLVTLNCFLIAGIVKYSGGIHSYMWILYLLPIFTAAVMLELRHLISTVLLGLFLMGMSYGSPLYGGWDYDIVLEISSKSALLVLGALLMYSMSNDKKKVETVLNEERKKLDKMSSDFVKQGLSDIQVAGMAEIGKHASRIIHDLGTPITVILGSARMLSYEENINKEDVQRIIDAAILCKNIVSGSLQLAREGGEYKFSPIDLRDPMESAIAIAMPLLVERNIEITRTLAKNMHFIKGSEVHLERLFINLLSNAKGAMPSGGKINVLLRDSQDKKWIEVVFEDTGPGFPAEIIENGPRTFGTTKKPGEGTGLGLMVCKEVVEKHGGVFELSNRTFGSGAVIKLRFPMLVIEPALSAAKAV